MHFDQVLNQIKTLINKELIELMLIQALIMLSSQPKYSDKTPDEIFESIQIKSKELE